MSVVDDRIVEMQFDNAAFERNAKQSLTTLDKLKNAINIGESAKGMRGLDAFFSHSAFQGVAGNLDMISSRFSAMGMVATTVLQNIINKVVQTGEHLVKEFTVEPIMGGFREYELKMGSVQTIMASSHKDLATVNQVLAELNTYADKTIYSFSDMTSSIGKFTNAGVDLDVAVKAIQGISNEAALSGANANEASRAMYNFAQALSSGAVKLIDWKSIENANMATSEFKQVLLDSAEKMGTVTKGADGMYTALTKGAGGGFKETFNNTAKFNDSLSSCWMTTEVLIDALSRYSDANDEIGKRAFAAAQDVKTFSQLMDTLKEAAESGWGESMEYIIGDFNEAKELWTGVNNIVSGILDKQADSRNQLLKTALKGETNITQEGFEKLAKDMGITSEELMRNFRDVAEEHGTTVEEIAQNGELMKRVFEDGWISMTKLTETLSGSNGGLKELGKEFLNIGSGSAAESIKELQTRLEELGYSVGETGIDGLWGGKTVEAIKAFQEASGISMDGIIGPETLEKLNSASTETSKLAEAAKAAGMSTEEYVKTLKDSPNGRELGIDAIHNGYLAISKTLSALTSGFAKAMPALTGEGLNKGIQKVQEFSQKLIPSISSLQTFYRVGRLAGTGVNFLREGLVTLGGPALSKLGSAFKVVGTDVMNTATSFSKWALNLVGAADSGEFWNGVLVKMGSYLGPVADLVGTCYDAFKLWFSQLDKQAIFDSLVNKFKSFGDSTSGIREKIEAIRSKFEEFVNITGPEDLLSKIQHAFYNLTNNGLVENVVNGFGKIKEAILGLFGKGSEVDTENSPFSKLDEFAQQGGLPSIINSITTNFELLKKAVNDAGGVFGFLGKAASSFIGGAGHELISFIKNLVGGQSVLGLAKSILSFKILGSIFKTFKSISGLSNITKSLKEMKDILGNIASGGIMGLFTGGGGDGIVDTISQISKAFLMFAGSVVALAFAFEKFASFTPEQAASGLLAMGGAVLTVCAAIAGLTKFADPKSMTKLAAGFLIMSIAMGALASAFKKFAGIGIEGTVTGLAAMAGAMLVVVASMAAMKEVNASAKNAAGLLIMATAMNVLALAFKQFSGLSLEETGHALVSMMAAMGTAIVGFAALSAIKGGLIGSAVALGVMAGSMLLMSAAFKSFASVDLKTIGSALLGLVVTIGAMAATSALVSAFGIQLLAAAGIIAVFGVALSVLSGGLKGLGEAFETLKSTGSGVTTLLGNVFSGIKGWASELGGSILSSISGIGTTISTTFQNAKSWIFDGGLSEAVSGAISWGSELLGNITTGIAGIPGTVSGFFVNAKDWVLGENGLGGAISGALTWGGDIITNITTGLTGVGEQIGGFFTGAKEWLFGEAGLGGAMTSATTWGSDIITNLTTGLSNVAETIGGFFKGAKDAVFGATSDLGSIASEALNWGGSVVTNLSTGLSELWTTITGAFDISWEDVSTGLSEIPGKLFEWAKSLPGQITDGIGNMGGTVIEKLKSSIFGDDAKNETKGKDAGKAIKQELEAGVEDINYAPYAESVFVGISDELLAAAEDADGVKESGKKVAENVVSGISEGLETYKSNLSTSISGIFTNLNDSFFTSRGKSIGGKFAEGILDSKTSATSAANALSSTAASALSSFRASAIQSGNFFGQGFANGIQQEGGSVYAKAYQLGRDAISALKTAIAQGSPSKITTESGGFFGEGFVNGIASMIKTASDTAFNMGTSSVKALSKGIEHIGGIMNGSLELDPSIKPVLDLSDMQSGIQMANTMLGGLSSYVSPGFNGIQGAITTRNQNTNLDVVRAISSLGDSLRGHAGNTYNVGGISYSDGSAISSAVNGLINALEISGRM